MDEGVFKHDFRVIFLFHDGNAATDLFRKANSIFAPNSYFRSLPRVVVAFATSSSSEEGRIMIYRQVQHYSKPTHRKCFILRLYIPIQL